MDLALSNRAANKSLHNDLIHRKAIAYFNSWEQEGVQQIIALLKPASLKIVDLRDCYDNEALSFNDAIALAHHCGFVEVYLARGEYKARYMKGRCITMQTVCDMIQFPASVFDLFYRRPDGSVKTALQLLECITRLKSASRADLIENSGFDDKTVVAVVTNLVYLQLVNEKRVGGKNKAYYSIHEKNMSIVRLCFQFIDPVYLKLFNKALWKTN